MKPILAFFILYVGVVLNISGQTPADRIVGVWANEKHTSQNKIYKRGSFYEAKIIKAKENKYIGAITLYNLSYNGKLWTGKAKHPQNGSIADVTIQLINSDTLLITVSLAGITKSKNWYRVKS